MIPTDPDTLAAWAAYELRNAAAKAEYQHRLVAMHDADRHMARRLRLIAGGAA